jgi:WD40 repeat protein
VWDTASGEELHTLEGHKNVVYAIAFNNPYGYVNCRTVRQKFSVIQAGTQKTSSAMYVLLLVNPYVSSAMYVLLLVNPYVSSAMYVLLLVNPYVSSAMYVLLLVNPYVLFFKGV